MTDFYSEQAAINRYEDALADGYSDAEARSIGWPEPQPPRLEVHIWQPGAHAISHWMFVDNNGKPKYIEHATELHVACGDDISFLLEQVGQFYGTAPHRLKGEIQGRWLIVRVAAWWPDWLGVQAP